MHIKKLWIYTGAALPLDLLFFYTITRLHLEVLTKVAESMTRINAILAQKSIEFSESQTGNLNDYLLATPEFLQHYHSVLKWGAVFFLGALLAWILLQGSAWYLAHLAAGRRLRFFPYLGRFTLASLAGAALLCIVLFIVLGLVETGAVLPLISENEPFIFSAILAIIIGYFSVVLYAAPSMNGLRASIAKANPLALYYLGALALTTLGVVFGTWLFTIHWAILLAFSILLLIPSLGVYRYFFARFTRQQKIF